MCNMAVDDVGLEINSGANFSLGNSFHLAMSFHYNKKPQGRPRNLSGVEEADIPRRIQGGINSG